MKKYFSPYLEKVDNQNKNTRIALIVATFGILFFLGIAVTIPIRDTFYAQLFQKETTLAEERATSTITPSPTPPL